MASQAQIEANRANATKSTGPRTSEGKATVAQNAVRHGLLAEQVVIKGEDPGEFEFYRDAMLRELAPVGEVEGMLAERAVGLAWRLRRAERLQAEVFGTLLGKVASMENVHKITRAMMPRKMREGMEQAEEGQTEMGRALVWDYANYHALDRFGLYEARIERSFFKTMDELRKHQLVREAGPGTGKSEARNPKHQTNPNDRDVGHASPHDTPRPAGTLALPALDVATQTRDLVGAERASDSLKQSQLVGDIGVGEGLLGTEGHLG